MSHLKIQQNLYNKNGFAILTGFIPQTTLTHLTKTASSFLNHAPGAHSIHDQYNKVRYTSILDSFHLMKDIFKNLVSLTDLACSILNNSIYLYQLKINPNVGFSAGYGWHQDYLYWKTLDGMDSSNAINIAIFLDNVDMYNGPTIVIPQTHVNGIIAHENRLSDPNDKNLGTMLPYSIPKEAILAESSIHGFSAMTGVAGTAVFFHPNIYHCSLLNVSYAPRKILFITFVATNTTFSNRDAYRPLWLVNRDNQLNLPVFERTEL